MKYSYLVIAIFIAMLTPSFSAAKPKASPPKLIPFTEDQPALDNKGLVLIELAVGGTAPSIEISKLAVKLEDAHEELKSLSRAKSFKISLKDYEPGFYTYPLEPGVYQITQINAPYFDLPHKMDTQRDVKWRFKVEANKLNYIGKLSINRERSANYVDIKLLNRLAASLPDIKSTLSALPEKLALINGIAYQDRFLELLSAQQLNTTKTTNTTAK